MMRNASVDCAPADQGAPALPAVRSTRAASTDRDILPCSVRSVNTNLGNLRLGYCYFPKMCYYEGMKILLWVLDGSKRKHISANDEDAPLLNAALVFLCWLWGCTVSKAATRAIINYVRLMRGLDVEQAAAVLAIARWATWIAREQEK